MFSKLTLLNFIMLTSVIVKWIHSLHHFVMLFFGSIISLLFTNAALLFKLCVNKHADYVGEFLF